ncbi:hypothetical protein [Nocardia sp. NPDC052566]|uniref:hypothetical protein n=1 Tax=Nocardia sp. NPDC052566 TaxID=3364330 RepID=UPI0037CB2BCE
MTTKTIAVHGATGAQGSIIAERLAAAGWQVRALNSANAALDDIDALVDAYAGVDAVVVQLPLVFEPIALTHAESVLAALSKAGIERAVFNPAMAVPPEPIGQPFVDARVRLMRELRGVVPGGATVGPAGLYLENLLQPWSIERIVRAGEVVYPLPAEVPTAWVSLYDIGDVLAEALAGGFDPVTLVTGPRPATGNELAAAIGAAVSREVRWAPIEPAEYGRLMTPVIGRAAATAVAAIYEQAPPPLPAELLRPAPTTPEVWAARQNWTF